MGVKVMADLGEKASSYPPVS